MSVAKHVGKNTFAPCHRASLCTQPEMVIIVDDRLPVLNSIQDLDDVRQGGIWVERELSSPSTVPPTRHPELGICLAQFTDRPGYPLRF